MMAACPSCDDECNENPPGNAMGIHTYIHTYIAPKGHMTYVSMSCAIGHMTYVSMSCVCMCTNALFVSLLPDLACVRSHKENSSSTFVLSLFMHETVAVEQLVAINSLQAFNCSVAQ